MSFTLKQRLQAWWEGYDLPADASPEANDESPSLSLVAGGAAGPGDGAPTSGVADEPANIVSADRLDFLQKLWGEGQCRPGSKAHYESDRKVLILTDSTVVAEFGAGLGTAARIMAGNHVCYVDAYETDPLLCEAATQLCTGPDEQKFTNFIPLRLGDAPTERKYSRIVFNRYLHRLAEPLEFIRAIKDQLKEDGTILLTEYTAGAAGPLPDATQGKMDGFGAPRALISREVYVKALEDIGFTVRVKEDRSAQHLAQIASGWTRMDEMLTAAPDALDLNRMTTWLSQETARWIAMSSALKDGQLEFSRIVATV